MSVHTTAFAACIAALFACTPACRSATSVEDLRKMADRAGAPRAEIAPTDHHGPVVSLASTGPARFVPELFARFETERAIADAQFADGFYRAPGNEGFDAVIDRIADELRLSGYGSLPELTIEVVETPLEHPAWTPRSARLALRERDGTETVLHRFRSPADPDRTMLPVHAPSARVAGKPVLALEAIEPGSILVTSDRLSKELLASAVERGAALVLSSSLADYNRDPEKTARDRDAIQFTEVRPPAPLPVAQISPRSRDAIAAAALRGAELEFECEVEFAERPLRTVIATIVGASKPEEAIVVVAHVQEPGACDNASGLAGLLECARDAAGAIVGGDLDRPARSVVLVWGDEMAQSRIWLDRAERTTIAAISVDMAGESKAKTGAVALLERSPDPGALKALAPDEHTAWGARSVKEASLAPEGLAIVARCALADVATRSQGWKTAEHPFEGGSDHDVFLARGVPAVLFWHFPDFAYHTSLDRMAHVDGEELKRTMTAAMSTALALADPRAGDLDRYLESWRFEQDLRLASCARAGEDSIARAWRDWGRGARLWLRALCLGLPMGGAATATAKTP